MVTTQRKLKKIPKKQKKSLTRFSTKNQKFVLQYSSFMQHHL